MKIVECITRAIKLAQIKEALAVFEKGLEAVK